MDADDSMFVTPINPNNFPAKLWRLVNSPRYRSIHWDSHGEGIVIDQQLFESELLCSSKSKDQTNDHFKTSNFTSFIRQLNLYGFRKVIIGAGVSGGSGQPDGDLGGGDGRLHHFYNMYFRKDSPGLLVNLKRLTISNKARLAAGLSVNSRPPNRFQRLLSSSMDGQSKDEEQDYTGPEPIGQICSPMQQENLHPLPYISPAPHGHIGFPFSGLERTPIPPQTWSNTSGLLSGQVESSHFPEKSSLFPLLPNFPPDVTCTFQPSSTSMHVQQGLTSFSGGIQKYAGYTSSSYTSSNTHYSPACYPPAVFPCYPSPAHLEHLTGCTSTSLSPYQHFGYFQSPRIQSSYPMNIYPPIWSSPQIRNQMPFAIDLESMGDFCSHATNLEPLTLAENDPNNGFMGQAQCTDSEREEEKAVEDESTNFSLLVDVTCKLEPFAKEEVTEEHV